MKTYEVIRFPDYLEHHGVKGMKWGIWNEETRARRTGSKKPRHKDYTKMSDKKLKREVTRRRIINELKKYDAQEDLERNPFHVTEKTIKKVTAFLATITAFSVAAITAREKFPQAAQATRDVMKMGSSFIDETFLRPGAYGISQLAKRGQIKWLY